MSQIQRFRQEAKANAAKIMAVRQPRRALTEQDSKDSHESAVSSQRNSLHFPRMDNPKGFPATLAIHRRSDYCGYKQSSISRAKPIKLHAEPKQLTPSSEVRTPEINFHNISKLRKRFSLQPIHLRELEIEHQRMFQATSKSLQKEIDGKTPKSHTERHYHKQLREMLRLINAHTRASSSKAIPHQTSTNDSLEQTPQNLSHLHSQSSDEKSTELTAVGEKIQEVQQKSIGFNKPYYVQIKKRVENKMQKANKKMVLPAIAKLNSNNQEESLCGWTAQSFYPKNRAHFFEAPDEERLRLVEGEI